MLPLPVTGAVLGFGATVLFDLWQFGLALATGGPAPKWAMVGRWFRLLPTGTVFHDDIARAAPHPQDELIGWIAHYAVGIVYGISFALVAGPGWLASPTLLPAWVFGIVTIAFGWFLLQPGLGLGIAAANTPNPTRVRLLGLAAHSVFGLGLWLTALLLR